LNKNDSQSIASDIQMWRWMSSYCQLYSPCDTNEFLKIVLPRGTLHVYFGVWWGVLVRQEVVRFVVGALRAVAVLLWRWLRLTQATTYYAH